MSRVDPNQALMPTVLDRLIDPDSGGTAWRRGYGVEQMVQVVQRDLEDLLNTRQSCADLPEAFQEVASSIIAFGLPDLTSINAITPNEYRQKRGMDPLENEWADLTYADFEIAMNAARGAAEVDDKNLGSSGKSAKKPQPKGKK